MSISASDILVPTATGISTTDDTLTVELADGRSMSVPLTWFPRLLHASAAERDKWQLIGRGSGIHWPMIEEDISIAGLIAGRPSAESAKSLNRWLAERGK